MFVYDVVWVFCSASFTAPGQPSVMQAVAHHATALHLPVLLHFASLFSEQTFSVGLGDVVLPGTLIAWLYCYDAAHRTRFFWSALAAYLTGRVGCSDAQGFLRRWAPSSSLKPASPPCCTSSRPCS